MIELPRLPNNEQYPTCLACPARTFIEGKYYCDPLKFGKDKINHIYRSRPLRCPTTRDSKNSSDRAVSLLKAMLRGK